jgi:ribulose-5-phosphate 4-epimerase/fuculose-1-phosphate aldolase
MNENQSREEICRIGKSLFERGYVHSSAGNISVRLSDGYLITPTDAVLGFLDPARISKVSLDGEHRGGDKPSKTILLHKRIYQTSSKYQPQTSCIIHTHSTYCVAKTLLKASVNCDELLEPITPYLVMKVGRVPLIDYKRPGDPIVVDWVEQKIDHYAQLGVPIRAVMLRALGPVVWHDSAAKAMATLEEMEESAKLSFLTNAAHQTLDADAIEELRDVFGAQWNFNS